MIIVLSLNNGMMGIHQHVHCQQWRTVNAARLSACPVLNKVSYAARFPIENLKVRMLDGIRDSYSGSDQKLSIIHNCYLRCSFHAWVATLSSHAEWEVCSHFRYFKEEKNVMRLL